MVHVSGQLGIPVLYNAVPFLFIKRKKANR